MITKQTVFILGAGASCPYKFPSGAQLRKEICDATRSGLLAHIENTMVGQNQAIRQQTLEKVKNFANKFRDSHTKSIDLFLARNSYLNNVGKYIISHKILQAEQQSRFGEQSLFPEQDWYFYLFNKITESITSPDFFSKLSNNKISFITFNYDRSLEHFLYTSLCNSFSRIEPELIAQELLKIKIIHVYGAIAPLEWQNNTSCIKYGQSPSDDVLNSSLENLRTIYELRNQEHDQLELEDAHELIQKAERIFLLGIGYAKENLDLLKLPQLISNGAYVFGTAYKMEDGEVNSIKKNFIAGLTRDPQQHGLNSPSVRIQFIDMDCLRLLKNYL